MSSAAVIVPLLAASAGLEVVANDSRPSKNNCLGAKGSTNVDPTAACPIAIAPY